MVAPVSPPLPLHVTATGSGRPVILIHGWPLSSASWALQVPALTAAGHQVITYDRRGFGASPQGDGAYDCDTLADDLAHLIEAQDLRDITLVGFSMGGGEVARYITRHGEGRLHSIVLASAVTPFLLQTRDNPCGPLTRETLAGMEADLAADRTAFFDRFATQFYSVPALSFGSTLMVSEDDRQKTIDLCHQSDQTAALACLKSLATTDFTADLANITVPTLVLHGDADMTVPLRGTADRTHRAVAHSDLVEIIGAPHGCNVSHAVQFNTALVGFLEKDHSAGLAEAAA